MAALGKSRLLGLALALAVAVGPLAPAHATSAAATPSVVGQLLISTNLERTEHGDQPLTLNTELTAAAQQKAKNMFDEQYWAHVSPSGTEPWHWIDQTGYSYRLAAENLARGYSDGHQAVEAWMDSPGHRRNLLDPSYHDVGFAAVQGVLGGESTTIVVAMYGAAMVPFWQYMLTPMGYLSTLVLFISLSAIVVLLMRRRRLARDLAALN